MPTLSLVAYNTDINKYIITLRGWLYLIRFAV